MAMQFERGTDVLSAEGKKVGVLDRMVLHPQTREATHIVVEKGWLFPEDKVIPIDLVDSATEEAITLKPDMPDLEELPPLYEAHFVPIEEADIESEELQDTAASLYWYPPVGTSWWRPAGYLGYPRFFGYPEPNYVLEAERNIPEDTVPLREGAPVYSADGAQIGNIERLFVDPDEERVTHLLLSKGLFLTEEKMVPTTWITLVEAHEVHLAVTQQTIERLPEHKE